MQVANREKTHCRHGHRLAGANLHVYQGRRVCRACGRRRLAEHRKRHPRPRVPRQPVATTPILARVLARIERRNGCWVWLGATSNGYAIVQRGRRGEGTTRAHRVVYEAEHGQIPAGLDVMHSCHNRACVNPAHLTVGTRAENMEQSRVAGRLKRS